MAFVRRLCVAGLLAHRPGEQLNSEFGDHGLEWLFHHEMPGSIASFWRDSTGGLVELRADQFGWREIESSAVVDGILTNDRSHNAQTACDVLTGAGVPVGRYDALVVMIGGRAVGAGAASVKVDGRQIPCAFLDDRGQHTFMCHEVGHTIGLGHSFRPSWVNPGYSFGEYGDPYDIMSAMTFGARPVTWALPFDPRADIAQSAVIWSMAGSGVAMATLWRYLPGYPSPPPWVRVVPADGSATEVRLDNSPIEGATRLIAMPDHAGGWWTVEYRPAAGWDRALALDQHDYAGAPGLVIHRIGDLGVAGLTPDFLPQRVSYEGTIPAPSAGSDDWSVGSFSVRALEHGDNYAVATVGVNLPATSGVRLEVDHKSYARPSAAGPSVELALTGPSCSTGAYTTEAVGYQQVIAAYAGATGLRVPVFTFLVNGQTIATSNELQAVQGEVAFPADVAVPTGYLTSETEPRRITATYNIVNNRLVLVIPAGDGAYRVDISVRAASFGQPEVIADQSIDVTTYEIRLPEAALEAQSQCGAFLDQPDTSGGGALVQQQIEVLVAAANVPGTDRLAIAGRLSDLSDRQDSEGNTALAVQAQQAAVSVLSVPDVPATAGLARSVYTLAVRLLADGQQVQSIAEAGIATEDYWAAAAQPGAELDAVSTGLADVGRLLGDIQPPLLDPLLLGRTLRALAVADREVGFPDQAVATAEQAMNVDLSAIAIANPGDLAAELTAVAGLLSSVGMTAQAVDTQREVVDLLSGEALSGSDRAEHLISLAEAKHNLLVALIDDHRASEAASCAADVIAAYRAYTGAVAHPDVLRLNRDIVDLQKQLNAIGLAAEPVEALQLHVVAFEGSSPANWAPTSNLRA